MTTFTEKEAQCFLQSLDFIHNKKLNKLIRAFGSCTDVLTATEADLSDLLLPEETASILGKLSSTDIATPLRELYEKNVQYYILSDSEYPESLKHIPSPPPAIYVRGQLPDSFFPKVAIIGARNCTAYGSQMAKEYAKTLAYNNIPIISGMARGIDGIAELAAINAGGYTCSVLGCGVDICYPKENRIIYDSSLKNGGIISEYPPGTAPHPKLFPPRNRIISGLADAVLVIEARERSGTLITVNMALDQGRDVYALPGRTTDFLSYGCNMLIKEGAIPLISPELFLEDFLPNFGFGDKLPRPEKAIKSEKATNLTLFLTADERLVLSVLDFIPKSISEIYCALNEKTSMSIPALMQLLTNMTLQRKIKCIDGNNYYTEED